MSLHWVAMPIKPSQTNADCSGVFVMPGARPVDFSNTVLPAKDLAATRNVDVSGGLTGDVCIQ